MASEDTGDQAYIGHSTLDVVGPRCTVRSFRCTQDGKDWRVEDEFTIDKADQQPIPTPCWTEEPSAVNISGYRAEVRGQTDVPARVTVDCGRQPGKYTTHTPPVDVAQQFATSHSVWLQAL